MQIPNFFKGHGHKRGIPPGTPVYAGTDRRDPIEITVIDYNESEFSERTLQQVKECLPFKDSTTVSWINITGVHNPDLIRAIGDCFGLHPLVQEDILNTSQRAKLEDYDDYLYAVLKMVQWDETAGRMLTEQVSLVIGSNFVLSFQEQKGDVFDCIRDRLRSAKGRIRKMQADYLGYSLLDAIIDGYFSVLEKLGERMEALEEETIARPTQKTRERIYRIRQEGLFLRKSAWPVREMVGALERLESPLVSEMMGPYFRDLYDHAIQVIDTTETFREMLSGMLDTYLSSISNRMNEVMKVLTIIATIFIPLTFVAGIYGMNFDVMPELHWHWGYPVVWGIMFVTVAVMVVYFKRKKWL